MSFATRPSLRLVSVALVLWCGAWIVQLCFDLAYGLRLGSEFGWDPLGRTQVAPPSGGLNDLAFLALIVPQVADLFLFAWAVLAWGGGIALPRFAKVATLVLLAFGVSVVVASVLSVSAVSLPRMAVFPVLVLLLAGPLHRAAAGGQMSLDCIPYHPLCLGICVVGGLVAWSFVAFGAVLEVEGMVALLGDRLPEWRAAAGMPSITEALVGAGLAGLLGPVSTWFAQRRGTT